MRMCLEERHTTLAGSKAHGRYVTLPFSNGGRFGLLPGTDMLRCSPGLSGGTLSAQPLTRTRSVSPVGMIPIWPYRGFWPKTAEPDLLPAKVEDGLDQPCVDLGVETLQEDRPAAVVSAIHHFEHELDRSSKSSIRASRRRPFVDHCESGMVMMSKTPRITTVLYHPSRRGRRKYTQT